MEADGNSGDEKHSNKAAALNADVSIVNCMHGPHIFLLHIYSSFIRKELQNFPHFLSFWMRKD